jgi:hypothetical protein
MEVFAFNCFVCGEEFVDNSKKATLNISNFRICSSCLNSCDPKDNYKQARILIENYISFSNSNIFSKVIKHIDNTKKK